MHPDLKAGLIAMFLIFFFICFAGVIGARHQENIMRIKQEHYHDSIMVIMKGK